MRLTALISKYSHAQKHLMINNDLYIIINDNKSLSNLAFNMENTLNINKKKNKYEELCLLEPFLFSLLSDYFPSLFLSVSFDNFLN